MLMEEEFCKLWRKDELAEQSRSGASYGVNV